MFFSLLSKAAINIVKLIDKIEKIKEDIQKKLASNAKKKEEKDKEKIEEEQKKNRKKLLAKIRRKILLVFLYIVHAILTVIDKILIFCLTHFLLAIVIVLIIVIVIITLMPWITETLSPVINNPSDDKAIVEEIDNIAGDKGGGGSSLSQSTWSEYELETRGTKLTNQEKNLYKLISLVKKYEVKYDTLDIHLTFGMGVSESGFAFYETTKETETKDILKDPITNPDLLHIKGDVKGNYSYIGYGGLFGMDLADIIWGQKYEIDKSEYKPTGELKNYNKALLKSYGKTKDDLMGDAYVPYSVQRLLQLNSIYKKTDKASCKDEAIKALDAVGLVKSEENIDLLIQLTCVRRSLHASNIFAQNCYYFNAMIMKCASDNNGKVDLTRWGTAETTEPVIRTQIIGTRKKGKIKIDSVDDLETSKPFTLNGVSINCTMWQYFKKIWGNEDWWKDPIVYDSERVPTAESGLEAMFLHYYNRAIDEQTGKIGGSIEYACIFHFGIARYLGAENIINSITSKLTGGSNSLTEDTFLSPLIDCRNNAESLKIVTSFGYDWLEYNGSLLNRIHYGIDIIKIGDAHPRIAAAREGTVVAYKTNWDATSNPGTYGNYVIIKHDNGWYTTYMHLDKVNTEVVYSGAKVTTESILGTMGTTGMSTGNHLHWQISTSTGYEGTTFINPKAVCKQLANVVSAPEFHSPEECDVYGYEKLYGKKYVLRQDDKDRLKTCILLFFLTT